MTYTRVLPRDLFNEAKLLKCIGKLFLLIEDGVLPWLKYEYRSEMYDDYTQGFEVTQDPNDGSISISNILFWIEHNGQDVPLRFSTPLNCKETWPLLVEVAGQEFYVLSEGGNLLIDSDGRQILAVLEATQ